MTSMHDNHACMHCPGAKGKRMLLSAGRTFPAVFSQHAFGDWLPVLFTEFPISSLCSGNCHLHNHLFSLLGTLANPADHVGELY